MQNLSNTLSRACLAAQSETWKWLCVLAATAAQFVKVPLFFLDSTVDAWQLGCILTAMPISDDDAEVDYMSRCFSDAGGWNTCVRSYADALTPKCSQAQIATVKSFSSKFLTELISAGTVSKPNNGAFITSCVSHCGFNKLDWNEAQLSQPSSSSGGSAREDVSMQRAVGQWWRDIQLRSNNHEHIYLPCELHAEPPFQCNPTCPTPVREDVSWEQTRGAIQLATIFVLIALLALICSKRAGGALIVHGAWVCLFRRGKSHDVRAASHDRFPVKVEAHVYGLRDEFS